MACCLQKLNTSVWSWWRKVNSCKGSSSVTWVPAQRDSFSHLRELGLSVKVEVLKAKSVETLYLSCIYLLFPVFISTSATTSLPTTMEESKFLPFTGPMQRYMYLSFTLCSYILFMFLFWGDCLFPNQMSDDPFCLFSWLSDSYIQSDSYIHLCNSLWEMTLQSFSHFGDQVVAHPVRLTYTQTQKLGFEPSSPTSWVVKQLCRYRSFSFFISVSLCPVK